MPKIKTANQHIDDEARENMREGFAEDMAKHQAMTGKIPTPAENERLAGEFLNRLENQIADQPPSYGSKPGPTQPDEERPRKADDIAKQRGMKMLRGGALAKATKTISVAGNAKTAEFYIKLQCRIDLLLTKQDRGALGQPSWRERVLAAMATATVDKARGTAELLSVARDSVKPFGDFLADEDRPIYSHS